MKNDTSASRGVLCSGRCQRRSTWPTMFCRYSGNGNSTPSVLTVATSDPVEGVSPGRGAAFGVVRRAAPASPLDVLRLGDQAYVAHARLPDHREHLYHVRIGDASVGPEVHPGRPFGPHECAERSAKVLVAERRLVEVDLAVAIEADHEAGLGLERSRRGARQPHVHAAL